jgi:hypothetical protein
MAAVGASAGRRQGAIMGAAVMLLCATATGCAEFHWPGQPDSNPPALVQPTNTAPRQSSMPSSGSSATIHRTPHHRRRAAEAKSSTTKGDAMGKSTAPPEHPQAAESGSGAAGNTVGGPQVTLAGQAVDVGSTERLLDKTAQRLGRLDRAKLSKHDAAAYDQVGDLLSAGREALRRHSLLVASGFAQKATTLMERLPAPR